MRHSKARKTGRFGLVMDPQMRVAIERETPISGFPIHSASAGAAIASQNRAMPFRRALLVSGYSGLSLCI